MNTYERVFEKLFERYKFYGNVELQINEAGNEGVFILYAPKVSIKYVFTPSEVARRSIDETVQQVSDKWHGFISLVEKSYEPSA